MRPFRNNPNIAASAVGLTAIATLLSMATPALAQPADTQPLINIVRGSAVTPGGVALMTLADSHLEAARKGLAAGLATGDVQAESLAMRQAARELDPASSDPAAFGLVRATAGIAANADVAAQAKGASAAVREASARIDACAGAIIDRAQSAADLARGGDAARAAELSHLLELLANGNDAEGACGLVQLKRTVAQMAGAAGL